MAPIVLDDTASIEAAVRGAATSTLIALEEISSGEAFVSRYAAELYQLVPIGAYAKPWVLVLIADDEPELQPFASQWVAEAAYEDCLEALREQYAESCGDHEFGDIDDDEDED